MVVGAVSADGEESRRAYAVLVEACLGPRDGVDTGSWLGVGDAAYAEDGA